MFILLEYAPEKYLPEIFHMGVESDKDLFSESRAAALPGALNRNGQSSWRRLSLPV